MYFMQALVHLIDLGVFAVEKGSLVVDKSETVVFPTTLDELIQKRLIFLKNQDENLFKFFACILLIGPQLDLASIKLFNSPKVDDYLSILDNKGFIYSANGVIQVQNYNFAQGLQGTDSAYLTIGGVRGRSFETKVAKDSNGELKIYCEADLIL